MVELSRLKANNNDAMYGFDLEWWWWRWYWFEIFERIFSTTNEWLVYNFQENEWVLKNNNYPSQKLTDIY